MNTIKRLWAWLTGGRLVWLIDHDGEETLAIARENFWGELTAERWWPCGIREVVLLDGGKTLEGPDGYVDAWKDGA